MNKSSLIQRTYNGSDAKMLSFCNVIHRVFVANVDAFTAFDANLNAAYAVSFNDSISRAVAALPDTIVVAGTMQHTADLNAKMVEARDAFLMQKFFVIKAFANSPAIWNEFGFYTYTALNRNPEKLLQFIKELYETSVKYETELAAAGFGATHLSALATIIAQLQTLLTTQQLSIGQRTTATNQRIVLRNTARNMCRTICRAAKIIYAADYGMYQYFLVPRHKNKKHLPAVE